MQLQSTNGLQTDTSPLVASAIHVPSRSLPSFYWRLDVAHQSVWITIHWARRVTLVLGLLPRPEWLHSSTDHLEATPAVIKIVHSSRCPASFCLRIRETVGLRILGSAKSPENDTKGSWLNPRCADTHAHRHRHKHTHTHTYRIYVVIWCNMCILSTCLVCWSAAKRIVCFPKMLHVSHWSSWL